MTTKGSNSTILDTFWAEARAELAAQNEAQARADAERFAKARSAIIEKVPAEILSALGIDLAELQWPPQHSDAFAAGVCSFNGETIETKVTTDRYGWVALYVGGDSVPLGEKVRANVGLALGSQLVKKQSRDAHLANEQRKKAERMLDGARNWGLDDLELKNRALTAENLPFLLPEQLAQVRATVAQRKWAARQKRHEERRQASAKRAALEAQAHELLAVCRAWASEWDAYNAAGEAWARRWTADLAAAYGPTELWKVTYGPVMWPAVAAGCYDDEDDRGEELVKWTVVLESPADLPEAVRGLTCVTEVTQAGQTREVWIGPVLRMETMSVKSSISQRMDFHRSVTCGEWVVNVPPTAASMTNPAADKPGAIESLGTVLERNGFNKVASKVRWGDWGSYSEVAGLDLAGAVDLLE